MNKNEVPWDDKIRGLGDVFDKDGTEREEGVRKRWRDGLARSRKFSVKEVPRRELRDEDIQTHFEKIRSFLFKSISTVYDGMLETSVDLK